MDMGLSYRDCGALVAFCAAMIPAAAGAQGVSMDRIEAIEKQIRDLQNQLQQLKGELGEAKQQLRQSKGEAQRAKDQLRQAQEAAQQAQQDAAKAATTQSQATQAATQAQAAAAAPPAPAAPSEGIKVAFPGGRPTISSADGRMSFAIGNQTQFDYGTYYQNPGPNTQFPELNNGVNLRRERIFFVARYDDFTLNVTPDFGGSPDGTPTLYEANLNFTGFKPITATLGYFKPWFSLYDSQSSNDFLLMERPSIIEVSRNVAAGDARATIPGLKASNDGISLPWGSGSYFAALALTGAPFGANSSNSLGGEQLGMVGRAAGRPYYDKDWNLHLDVSGEYVFHPNINNSGTPGVSQQTLSFSDRPEFRIDNNRLISTGNLSSSNASVIGGEAAINWRNLLLQGGYYQIYDTQQKLPNVPAPGLSFNGGYVEAGWNITGEPFRYNVGSAAFARPKVDDPFIINEDGFSPGIGAWQLAARYSLMNLNSNVTPGVSQSVTGGVFGGYQRILGAALSWYPNDWIRFELQFQYTQVDRLNSAGMLQIGQNFSTLAGRMQVAF